VQLSRWRDEKGKKGKDEIESHQENEREQTLGGFFYYGSI